MKKLFILLWAMLAEALFFVAVNCGAVKCFAKVKFGFGIAEMYNKIGGAVFSRNRSGSYVRNKVSPVNPQTVAQAVVKNFFTAVTQAWRGLTQAQILAWNKAVSNFVGTDVFGDSRTPSGKQLHQQLNMNLTVIGEAVIADPPVPVAINAFLTLSIAASTGAGTLIVTYTDPINAGDSVIVYASPAVSPGKTFVKSEMRQIAIMAAADVTPYDISTEYDAVFGGVGALGQKIFLAVRVINKATGISGTKLKVSTIIVA